MTLKISALTKLGLFLPVVSFIRVFDQTLAEQLYRDKDLLSLAALESNSTVINALKKSKPQFSFLSLLAFSNCKAL